MNHGSIKEWFDIKKRATEWVRSWVESNSRYKKLVIPFSYCDSFSLVESICIDAVGANNIVEVYFPDVLDRAHDGFTKHGVRFMEIPVTLPVTDIMNQSYHAGCVLASGAILELPTRLREDMLYSIARTEEAAVVGTCSLTELVLGRQDIMLPRGDICPVAGLTLTEIRAIVSACIGSSAGTYNNPDLEGRTGLSVSDIDKYIRTGESSAAFIDAFEKGRSQLRPTFNILAFNPNTTDKN